MNALFAIGSNGSGQLGIGHKEDVSVPKPVIIVPEQPVSPIVKVAAGGNHTLLLTRDGQLYCSGDSTTGACGLGAAPERPVFQKARLSRDDSASVGEVVLVAATWEASLFVAKDGAGRQTKLFSLGVGMKGELGLGELIIRTPTSSQVKAFPPAGAEIVDLAACMGHVIAVLNNGDAYGWGNCRKSQVGEPAAVIYEPRKIEGVGFKITRAVCCKETTILFGGPDSGNIHIIGSDKWGIRSSAPASIPLWKDVGASWGNVYILTQTGELLSWGRDDHGQLPPPNLPPIKKIAVGSEHVVALSDSGEVLAWGWGEHGNCGPQVEDNDVKGRWNVIASSKYIPAGSHIDTIGAGCATSWISITSE